ncbi:MFS multidrug transporter [Colletotrichum musicola]|uniref:MFS multidrug transporter n=1 Tax=Colletotrichum musicola TaxID=2175873 RepID=A0A8H6J4H9_9PEZI|nr:MFS multidrug transporter [Colletotrichum musicola]
MPFDTNPHEAKAAPDGSMDTVDLEVTFDANLPIPVLDTDNEATPPDLKPPVHLNAKFRSPLTWSTSRRSIALFLLCMASIFSSVAASAYSPTKEAMASEWGVNRTAVLVGITIFTTGFAFTPMILAPISEVWGRKLVFASTGVVLVICQICSAEAKSYSGMMAARFFAGVGCSSYSGMIGGTISDIYAPHERNTPMTIFSGCALFGAGLGPLVSGFIVQYASWRWVFWMQAIANALVVVSMAAFIPETRSNVLLQRKAEALNEWYGKQAGRASGFVVPVDGSKQSIVSRQIRWNVKDNQGRGSIGQMIATSVTLPFMLLFTEPVVFFFSLWATFSWSIVYICFAAVPLVFTEIYHFNLSSANAVFASTCVAAIIAPPISIYQERWLDRHPSPRLPLDRPERRLYFSCVESILLPIGLFVFGWTAREQVHWVVPALGIGLATLGVFSVYLAVFNYLADSYHGYASSALAAQSSCRNFIAGILPLVTLQMYTNLGYGPASSLLGGIGLRLTAGPWVLVGFGETIREKSRFANKLNQ